MKAVVAARQRSLVIILLLFIFVANLTFSVRAQDGGGVLTGGSPSGEIVAQGGSPVPGGPGYVTLSGLDFRPFSSTASYYYNGTILVNQGTSQLGVFATFNIPNGATIKKMVVYYWDIDGATSKDLSVDMLVLPLAGNYAMYMANFRSSGAIPTGIVYGETSTINSPVVDLSINSYAIQVTLPTSANVGLNAVRIDYAYETALPVLTNNAVP